MLPSRYMQHPLLLHLPAALWVASFVLDLLALAEHGPGFAAAAFYVMLLGLLTAGLALPASIGEYLAIPSQTRPKRIATFHVSISLAVTLLFLINFFNREGQSGGAPSGVTLGQASLSAITLLALAISGSIGSRMAPRAVEPAQGENRSRHYRPAA